VGSGPCARTRKPDVHDGLRDARRGQSWHRRSSSPMRPVERRRRTWTHSSAEGRPKVRMLLSFQRPSHLFWKGGSFPLGALPGTGIGSGPRGGPTSIAPKMPVEEGPERQF
jgi:hypothetical protein